MSGLVLAHALLALLWTGVSCAGYDYGSQQEWGEECSSRSQSPIDITTPTNTTDIQQLIVLPGTCKNVTLHRAPVATTIKFKFPTEGTELRDVPILEKNVTIKQIHVHWGGSEHMVNGLRYAMESHLVTTYRDHEDEDRIKIAVFARLFIVGAANPEIEKLVSAEETEAEQVQEFNAQLLYPPTIRNVYVYTGSLTTPPCTEGVFWAVVEEPLTVSRNQLKRMKDLVLGENNIVLQNYRHPQELNGRQVLRYNLHSSGIRPAVSLAVFLFLTKIVL